MTREKMPCERCGVPADIVPAGTSRKTGKPYGSFYKCGSCGFGKSLEPKPRVQAVQSATTENPQLGAIIVLLESIRDELAKQRTGEPNL